MAACLHITVQLPDSDNEQTIREQALLRSIEIETMNDYRPHARRPAASAPPPEIQTGSNPARATTRRVLGIARILERDPRRPGIGQRLANQAQPLRLAVGDDHGAGIDDHAAHPTEVVRQC